MTLVVIEDEDFGKVEHSQLNRWRVWDGENWAHGFRSKERAIEIAERVGGTRIAFCKKIKEKVHYVSAQKIKFDKEVEE